MRIFIEDWGERVYIRISYLGTGRESEKERRHKKLDSLRLMQEAMLAIIGEIAPDDHEAQDELRRRMATHFADGHIL